MTLSVWKFSLIVADSQSVAFPVGAQLLTVQVQNGVAQLWALCDASGTKAYEPITILMRGTGHDIDEGTVGQYLGTVQLNGGALIFHFFAAPR